MACARITWGMQSGITPSGMGESHPTAPRCHFSLLAASLAAVPTDRLALHAGRIGNQLFLNGIFLLKQTATGVHGYERAISEIHVVIIPKKHVASLLDPQALDGELLTSVLRAIQEAACALHLDDKGFQVQANAASPGVTPHMHWHLKSSYKYSASRFKISVKSWKRLVGNANCLSS
jgi:hypothetical protein